MMLAMQLRPSLKFVKLSYVFCLLLAVGLGVYILAVKEHPESSDLRLRRAGNSRVLHRNSSHSTAAGKSHDSGDRLRYESGLFSKTTRTIELVKVQDVRVEQSLGQRMVNLGDLSLETAGGTSRIEIDSIDSPQEAAEHILALAQAQRSNPPAAGTP